MKINHANNTRIGKVHIRKEEGEEEEDDDDEN
jgi:hypothetical protein